MSIMGIGVISILIIVGAFIIVKAINDDKNFNSFDDGIKGWR